jgi:hypothetical protein
MYAVNEQQYRTRIAVWWATGIENPQTLSERAFIVDNLDEGFIVLPAVKE